MARKTNEELRLMSVQELEYYGETHPAEAARISRILAKSSTQMFKVSLKYAVTGNLQPMVEIGAIQPSY